MDLSRFKFTEGLPFQVDQLSAGIPGVFREVGYREEIASLLALLCTEAPREVVEFDGMTFCVALGPRCLP